MYKEDHKPGDFLQKEALDKQTRIEEYKYYSI